MVLRFIRDPARRAYAGDVCTRPRHRGTACGNAHSPPGRSRVLGQPQGVVEIAARQRGIGAARGAPAYMASGWSAHGKPLPADAAPAHPARPAAADRHPACRRRSPRRRVAPDHLVLPAGTSVARDGSSSAVAGPPAAAGARRPSARPLGSPGPHRPDRRSRARHHHRLQPTRRHHALRFTAAPPSSHDAARLANSAH